MTKRKLVVLALKPVDGFGAATKSLMLPLQSKSYLLNPAILDTFSLMNLTVLWDQGKAEKNMLPSQYACIHLWVGWIWGRWGWLIHAVCWIGVVSPPPLVSWSQGGDRSASSKEGLVSCPHVASLGPSWPTSLNQLWEGGSGMWLEGVCEREWVWEYNPRNNSTQTLCSSELHGI